MSYGQTTLAHPRAIEHDIQRAVAILKAGGCREVFLFGSAVTGTLHAKSDLDFAVRGCPPANFFRLLGRLMSELDRPVDLVDLDQSNPFVTFLLAEGHLVALD